MTLQLNFCVRDSKCLTKNKGFYFLEEVNRSCDQSGTDILLEMTGKIPCRVQIPCLNSQHVDRAGEEEFERLV